MEPTDIPNVCKTVFQTLGSGYRENIYHNAVKIELQKNNYKFGSEVICPIVYQGIQVGYERADILIYNSKYTPDCVLEFKAQSGSLGAKEILQIRKYLRNFNLKHGFLINFSNNIEILMVTLDDTDIVC